MTEKEHNDVLLALYHSGAADQLFIKNRYDEALSKAGKEGLYIGGASLIASLGFWLIMTFVL